MRQEPTFKFYVPNAQGELIDLDTLTEEQRQRIGVEAYRTMLRALNYQEASRG